VDFRFSPEEEAFRQELRTWLEESIPPDWEGVFLEEDEESWRFGRDFIKKLAQKGWMAPAWPREYGGMEASPAMQLVFHEEMGYHRAPVGSIMQAVGYIGPSILMFGTEEQKNRHLPAIAAGETVWCQGFSEPEAGSDLASLQTRAVRDGDDYIINGSKMWITNSPKADFICLLANTSDDKPHKNKSLIIVPMNTPGITMSPHLNKLGMRSSETAQIFFDDVRVPQRYRIGAEGTGFMMQMLQFQEERLWGAANVIKALENCINQTIDYCRERKTFGIPLIDNQVIHFRLAELQTEVEALRALTYQACELHIEGKEVTKLASMAKLKAGRLGREVTDSCLQYWGGNGYMWDNPVSRAFRDVRLVSIGGGADEIMLGIICKMMGTLPGKRKS